MTIGDVMAFALGIAATAGTLWAAIVGAAILFGAKARVGANAVSARPGNAIITGAIIAGLMGLIGIVLANAGPPIIKFAGLYVLLTLVVLATFGSACLALLVADRIREADSKLSHFANVGRGAALLVGGGLVPGVGQLLVMPVLVFASLGATWFALFQKKAAIAVAAAPVAPTTPLSDYHL